MARLACAPSMRRAAPCLSRSAGSRACFVAPQRDCDRRGRFRLADTRACGAAAGGIDCQETEDCRSGRNRSGAARAHFRSSEPPHRSRFFEVPTIDRSAPGCARRMHVTRSGIYNPIMSFCAPNFLSNAQQRPSVHAAPSGIISGTFNRSHARLFSSCWRQCWP